DKIVRRDDERGLPTCTKHVVSILRHRKRANTIDPEEGAIDRSPVGFPSRRKRAYEFGVTLRKNSFAVPNAILKIEVSKTRPVSSGTDLVSLPEKVSERIGFDHHRADADLVEECTLRERQVVLPTLFHCKSDQVIDQHRIGVVVASDRIGRPL